MTDELGPYDCANASTVRPADTTAQPAQDFWYVPCSTPTSQDGTQIRATVLNRTLANLRALWRGNGPLISGSPIVPDNYSDNGLVESVLQLIQRWQTNVGIDVGTANALVVNPAPAVLEYKRGMPLVVEPAASVSGATTINVSGLGAVPITWPDGSQLAAGDWNAGDTGLLLCWGGGFVLASAGGPTIFQRANAPFNPFTATGVGAAMLCNVASSGGSGPTDNYFLDVIVGSGTTFSWGAYSGGGGAAALQDATITVGGGTVTVQSFDARFVSAPAGVWKLQTTGGLTPGFAIALRIA